MSRIGKKPVGLPSGVTASLSGRTIEVKGPKGTRSFSVSDDISITVEGSQVVVGPRGNSKRARQQWGMCRTPCPVVQIPRIGFSHYSSTTARKSKSFGVPRTIPFRTVHMPSHSQPWRSV
mgnify:CR=1 FL=1